jgi:glycosyltransferase involved in cell wall biosynthesis
LRIWSVTVGEPLPGLSGDARPWRGGYLARLLADRGHEVTWWTSSFDHFGKRHFVTSEQDRPVAPGLTLRFLHGRAYHRNISINRYLNHLEIARSFRRQSRKAEPPEVIVSSFPPIELCKEVASFGARRHVPVLLDVRDLWPDELEARSPAALRPLVWLASRPMRQQARRALQSARGIVAISSRYMRWGLAMADRAQTECDAVIPLGYTADLAAEANTDDVEEVLGRLGVGRGRRIFWFSGTFVGNIDLGTVIAAARLLRDRPDLLFVLTGSGEREPEWRAQADGLPNITFTGWADRPTLACLASVAWAGLGAYKAAATMSLPNKIFEYMSAGLPVISSLGGEAGDLVTREAIGLIYQAGNPADLAAKVARLADDAELRARLSANARGLFIQKFHPQTIYGRYADLIERLAGTVRP